MGRIEVLSDQLASQVAAGEVVERPGSVVRELIENSLDAGAREVEVEIRQGGRGLIRVADDGCGMSRKDALLSLERHATSKLRRVEDLTTIQTLGFRGEALPSVASVSKLQLLTREEESVIATRVLVEGGKLREVREAGGARGTTIEVQNLFFNVPARRKFLKAERTESAHVEHMVRSHSLANCEVRFVFRKDGRLVFDWPGVRDRRVRLAQMGGIGSGEKVLEVARYERAGITVEGFVRDEDKGQRSRRGQWVFLNGRPVEDLVLARGVQEGFRGRMPEGRHPVVWLWLEMDRRLVDVNVHPAKREVRFRDAGLVRTVVAEAITRVWQQPFSLPSAEAETEESLGKEESSSEEGGEMSLQPVGKGFGRASQGLLLPNQEGGQGATEIEKDRGARFEFKVLGVLGERYGLLEGEDGLVLFDPRAGRERVVYEWLIRGRELGEVASQGLLMPVILELEGRDLDIILRHRECFQEAGFEVEEFGGQAVRVGTVPAFLKEGAVDELVRELVDELVNSEESRSAAGVTFEKFGQQVARSAGRRQGVDERTLNQGLQDLEKCELPFCRPDGRPTLVQISINEIDRKFGKK